MSDKKDSRPYLYQKYDEKVEVGYSSELFKQVLGYEVPKRVLYQRKTETRHCDDIFLLHSARGGVTAAGSQRRLRAPLRVCFPYGTVKSALTMSSVCRPENELLMQDRAQGSTRHRTPGNSTSCQAADNGPPPDTFDKT